MIQIDPIRESRFDWLGFWVRFVCGAIPGVLLGFGFWIQMCRSPYALGLMEHFPRLVTEWLQLEEIVDSGPVGLAVVTTFALVSGMIVAVWPAVASHFTCR